MTHQEPLNPSAGVRSDQKPDSEPLTAEIATVFLKLGISGPRRPVDDLIDRLKDDKSGAWLFNALQSGPMRDLGSAAELLANGQASFQMCQEIKERSKLLVKQAASHQEKLMGIAGYFVAIAAGLRHHGKSLTTRDQSQLREILLDLAEVAPEPFARLLSEAALTPAH